MISTPSSNNGDFSKQGRDFGAFNNSKIEKPRFEAQPDQIPPQNLEAEESTSTTFGLVYDIPNGHTIGASWYDIVVENAMIEPSAAYIIYDCYYENPGYTSQFCDNVVRDATTGEFDYIAGG